MDHIKLLKQLISIKSHSGEENDLRNFISEWFRERQIDSFVQNENLVVHFEGIDRTKAFIFNSHMDTVSAGESKWRYGAWTPTIEADKLVGLGASDMKSGLTSSMLLAEQIAQTGKPPVDVWFTYVAKEEVDGSGTESFADWFDKEGYLKRYVDLAGIFTEPTGLKEIEHGHRGNMFIKVTTEGDSGHGSRPNKIKKHSIREMIRFADLLQEEFKAWRKEFSDSKFEAPTVGEMTSISAGDSPNKFPPACVATFDVRTTPDFHPVAFTRIKKLAKREHVKVEYAFPPAPAGYTNPKEKIISATKGAVKNPKLTVSKGSADLGFLTMKGVKAVIFGPGVKNQAHKTNEYCFPNQIPQAVETYKQIVDSWAK